MLLLYVIYQRIRALFPFVSVHSLTLRSLQFNQHPFALLQFNGKICSAHEHDIDLLINLELCCLFLLVGQSARLP